MAGGMKVAVSPAVDAGPWGGGPRGGGAVRLLLVLSGCLVCGSGTARGSGCQGGWFRGSYIPKSGERSRPGRLLCCVARADGEKEAWSSENGRGYGVRAWGAAWWRCPQWGGAWSLLVETGREARTGREAVPGAGSAARASSSVLVKRRETREPFGVGRAAAGKGASHSFSTLATPSACAMCQDSGMGG